MAIAEAPLLAVSALCGDAAAAAREDTPPGLGHGPGLALRRRGAVEYADRPSPVVAFFAGPPQIQRHLAAPTHAL